MNPTFQFLKTKGLKLSLPLLLLATACGDGTPSASSQGDVASVAGESVAAAAQPSSGFGTPSASDAGLPTPNVNLPADDGDDVSLSDVLPPSSEDGHSNGAVDADEATAVPEPAALLGLAIAAAGMVTLKRKQSA